MRYCDKNPFWMLLLIQICLFAMASDNWEWFLRILAHAVETLPEVAVNTGNKFITWSVLFLFYSLFIVSLSVWKKSMASPSLILHISVSLSFSSNAVVKIIWNNEWDYPVQRISRRQVSSVLVFVITFSCQFFSKIGDILDVKERKNFLFTLQIPAWNSIWNGAEWRQK